MSSTEWHPPAVSEEWDWQMAGACRGTDTELFFHPYGEREPSRSRRERAALAICARCPVMSQCRTYSMSAHEVYGVWGGLTEAQRQAELAAGELRRQARQPVALPA